MRNVDFRLVFRAAPSYFQIEFGKGNLPDFPVCAYDEVLAGILLPSSGAFFRPEVRGNLQGSARKKAVSGGIRPDPVTAIIDLGLILF